MRPDYFACGLREIKTGGTDSAMTFSGYGAVFGNVDSYGDVIDPGAFSQFLADTKSGKQDWPAMLSQHGGWGVTATDMTPIGVWTSLSEDGHGLKVEGQLADTPRGKEMYALMKMTPRAAIDGLSIGYIAKESVPRTNADEPRRRLKRVDLIEISPVTMPANRSARVTGVKSIEAIDEIKTIKDAEELLRESGFSRTQAVAFLSRVKRLGQSESDSGMSAIVEALRKRGDTFKTL